MFTASLLPDTHLQNVDPTYPFEGMKDFKRAAGTRGEFG
jgi:hypothetical protein